MSQESSPSSSPITETPQSHGSTQPEAASVAASAHPEIEPALSERLDAEQQLIEKKVINLADLPVDIQRQILSMLSPADRKRYRLVARFADAAGRAMFPNLGISSTSDLKAVLRSSYKDNIRSLVFYGGKFEQSHFRNNELRDLMHQKLGFLDSIAFSEDATLSMDDVVAITRNLPKPEQLKRLSIHGYSAISTLNSENLGKLLKNLNGLTHLDMRISTLHGGLTDLFVSSAFSKVKELTHLNISENTNLSRSRHESRLTNSKLVATLDGKEKLTYLDVSGCRGLTLPGIRTALSHAPNLERLVMADLSEFGTDNEEGVGTNPLSDVLATVPKLRHLDISNMKLLDAQKFHAAVRHTPHLERIDISGCKELMTSDFDRFVKALEGLPLTELGLSNLDYLLDDETLLRLLAACGAKLERLELSSSSDPLALSPEGLNAALSHTPGIRHLDVSSSTSIDNWVMPRLDHLESLDASDMQVLETIKLDGLPALKNLNLSGLAEFFDLTNLPAALAPVRKTLTRLNLSSVAGLSDEHFTNLDLSSYDKLTFLDLSNNDVITDAALDKNKLPPNLEYISIKGCANITDAALKRLPLTIQVIQY
jgi:hypothetical protein